MRIVYWNGQYVSVKEETIEAYAPGVLKAKGVFETMLGINGFLMDAPMHLRRLKAGLKVLGLKPPSLDAAVLRKVLKRNQLPYARVRLMVWQDSSNRHVMITALPYKAPSSRAYRVCLIRTDRAASDRLSMTKSLDYGLFAEAFSKAKARGFDEALLLNRRGHIFEASRANIFWFKAGVLYTPPLVSGCLSGITRRQVLSMAQKLKIPVHEKVLLPEELPKADTVFLTNSLIGVKEAGHIDLSL